MPRAGELVCVSFWVARARCTRPTALTAAVGLQVPRVCQDASRRREDLCDTVLRGLQREGAAPICTTRTQTHAHTHNPPRHMTMLSSVVPVPAHSQLVVVGVVSRTATRLTAIPRLAGQGAALRAARGGPAAVVQGVLDTALRGGQHGQEAGWWRSGGDELTATGSCCPGG